MNPIFFRALILPLCFPLVALADGFVTQIERTNTKTELGSSRERERIGKSFYAYLDREACTWKSNVIRPAPDYKSSSRYTADGPRRLTVLDVVKDESTDYNHYQVKIEDDTIGYIRTDEFILGDPSNGRNLGLYCLLEMGPQEMQQRLADIAASEAAFEKRNAQRQRDEEARAKRPGASIGMTAKQVIEKTRWGAPDRVNRTVTSSGTDEQWVYGGNAYLYFRNGRLYAIQN